MSWDEASFREKLENNHAFPGPYTFKFIVKPLNQERVEALVPNAEVSVKNSSGNKYVSVTLHAQMPSSEAVIDIYKEARKIAGLIAL